MVGARIRSARRELGLTQEKAAELHLFTGQFWSLLESGRERASINTYLQIAAILGLTLDDLSTMTPWRCASINLSHMKDCWPTVLIMKRRSLVNRFRVKDDFSTK